MSSSAKTVSYLDILKIPHAPRTFLAALVARLAYGTVFLALVLTVSAATGSYTMAGGVLALFGLTSSVLAPFRARLVDRYGARRALLPMACVCAVLLGSIAVVAWEPGAPRAMLWILGGASGATAPPVGPFMRSLWAAVIPSDRELLQRAYALDTVTEELIYVVGPLLAGAFTAFADPALGVAFSAALLLIGTAALVASPVVADLHLGPPTEREDRAVPGDRQSGPRAAPAGPSRRFWPGGGLLEPVVITAGLGAGLGALSLLTVAFADEHGSVASVSWIQAALSVSSVLGGLLYGAVSWRLSNQIRLPLLAVLLSFFCALAGLAGGMVMLAIVIAGAGFLISPALTTAYLRAGEVNPEGNSTEANTWVGSAFNTGNAAGSAGFGLLLAPFSVAACFVLAGVVIFLPAALVALRVCWQKMSSKKELADSPGPASLNSK